MNRQYPIGRYRARRHTILFAHQTSKAMLPRLLKLFRNGLAIFVLLAVPAISNTSGLKQETLNAWDDYLGTPILLLYRNLVRGDPFLGIEKGPGRSQRVRKGKFLISP